MFSRRHPYLYFLLIWTSVVLSGLTIISLVVFFSVRSSGMFAAEPPRTPAVGLVEISGFIGDSEVALRQLKRFREDAHIKAIVLRINSPGGGVGPSQEIFRELQRTAESKQVIASLGGVAASGGYYIAAGAHGIVANPGTITGSIGVIMGYADVQELLRKIGLEPVVIKSAPYKDLGSPMRTMSTSESAILQQLADNIHQQFIGAIAQGRGLSLEDVARLADGRIYSGEQAYDLGLVDRLGNLEDAVEWAGRLGGIEGDIKVIKAREPRFNLVRELLETAITATIGRVTGVPWVVF